MKNLLFRLAFLICLASPAFSQEDYLITLKGDSIAGKIEFTQGDFFDEVVIKTDDGKKKYKAFQLARIAKGGDFYEPVDYLQKKMVGKVVVKGPVSFYRVRSEGSFQFNSEIFSKQSGETLGISNIGFRKKTKAFFSDCPSLVEKLENGEFSSGKLEEIVTFYNSGNCVIPEEEPKESDNPSLADLADLIKDIENKIEKGEPVPSYMIQALEGFKEINLSSMVDAYIEALNSDNN